MSEIAKSPFQSRIKIFLDGADRGTLVEMLTHPLVSGFTTNPSLMKKAGVKDYRAYCLELLALVGNKPISFEVFADDFSEMKRQAKEIASWAKPGNQLYVKIPITNSRAESSIPLVKELSHQGVRLNITAIYTPAQVQATCDAVRGGAPSIVSVFAGRIGDSGRDPMPIMQTCAKICQKAGPEIELLWASTREALNIVQAEQAGCQIITSPVDMIKKVTGFNRELEQISLDTVKAFKSDAESAGFSL